MNDLIDATILEAVIAVIALIPQSVFHDTIPIVTWTKEICNHETSVTSASETCGYSEECKECHSECSEVCMRPQTLTWVLVITAEAAKHLNTQGRENKEQKEEEKALEVYCLILCYTPP